MIIWNILRAAGIGAYLMLFASVAWGLVSTTSIFGKRIAKASAVSIHQFLSTVAIVLLAIHLSGVLLDSFVKSTPLDVLIPLHSSFRPWAVAGGILAMYATVIVLASSWTRKYMNNKVWRSLHWFAFPAFALSMIHGIFAGTDTVRPWMWGTYLATGGIVFFLVWVRVMTAQSQRARPSSQSSSPAAEDWMFAGSKK